jgi:hypothetical protein
MNQVLTKGQGAAIKKGRQSQEVEMSALEVVKAIHGKSKGARVHFCAKIKGQFTRLASVRADEIDAVFHQIEPYLKTEAYFSLNGFWRAEPYLSSRTGLPIPIGTKKNQECLTGIFADIDTGRPKGTKAQQQDTQEAMAQALETIDKKGIPRPTYWIRSGRGFGQVWLYQEPIKAWEEAIESSERASAKLNQIHPAFDKACTPTTQVFRIAGTRHGITRKRAIWTPDATGANRYDPKELWDSLGIDAAKTKRYAVTINPKSCPQRKAGYDALFGNIEREILALHYKRGGIKEGMRRYALTIVAVSKIAQSQNNFNISSALSEMALQCQPAYPSHKNDAKVIQIIEGAREMLTKRKRRTAGAIIKRLEITQAEADELGFKTLDPSLIEIRKEEQEKRVENVGRPKQTERREFVRLWLKANPEASVREILTAGKDARVKCSYGSIRTDIRAIKERANSAAE